MRREPASRGEGGLRGAGLACTRGARVLFEKLDLQVDPGECLWVRGANGSGKTSLLRQLAGLSAPGAGTVHWNCQDIADCRAVYRESLLYVGHAAGTKDELSAVENLLAAAALEGVTLNEVAALHALDRLGLRGREDQLLRTMSQGQRRRVALSRLAWRDARLWILDEPLAALDLPAVEVFGELLRDHLDTGGLAVLTSHQSLPVEAAKAVQL